MKWFHECDDDALLYFVCDNINTLHTKHVPSVDIHDIDVSLLVKEISLMRYENMQVKDTWQQVVNECAENMEKLQRVVFQLGNNIKATIDASIEKMSRQQTRLENYCVKHITDVRDNISSILNDSLADPMVSGRETVPQAQGTSGAVQLNNEHSADGLAPCRSADSQLHCATGQVHVEPVDCQSPGEADTDIKQLVVLDLKEELVATNMSHSLHLSAGHPRLAQPHLCKQCFPHSLQGQLQIRHWWQRDPPCPALIGQWMHTDNLA